MSSPIMVTEIKVLVRGFNDKPVSLNLAGWNSGHGEVYGSDRRKSICLEDRFIYRVNSRLICELEEAFNKENFEMLTEIWKKAERLDFN